MSNLNNVLRRAGLAGVAMVVAAPAFAAPGDAPLSPVAAADRLTLAAVVTHAKPLVMLVFFGLAVAIAYAAFVYIRGLTSRDGQAARGQTFLGALAAGGPLIGLFGAAYGLMDMAIGIANVRPTPNLTVLAPGFAEAGLSVSLGLLAGALAVIGHRHLTARALRSAAPAAVGSASAPPLAKSLA